MTADTATSVNFAMSRNVFAKHFDVGIRFPDLLNEIVLGLAQLVMSPFRATRSASITCEQTCRQGIPHPPAHVATHSDSRINIHILAHDLDIGMNGMQPLDKLIGTLGT